MRHASATRGLLAMSLTVVVWAAFAISIRAIQQSSLSAGDVALLRFGVPVVILSPFLPRFIRSIRHEKPLVLISLFVGAGLPYFLVSAAGGAISSATLVGLIIPGSVPLFVAAIGLTLLGIRYHLRQLLAIGAIVVGVLVILATSPASVAAGGVLVLLGAGLIWAVYTCGLRFTTLDPVSAALAVCAPSLLLTAIGIATGALESHLMLGTAAASDVLFFAVVQGLGVGVLAGLCYAIAVRSIGPQRAAMIGSLSPVIVAIVASLFLNETLTPGLVVGGLLIVAAVVAFNLFGSKPTPAPQTGTPMLVDSINSPRPDPLWSLAADFARDARVDKHDLVVGVYRDDDGHVPNFRAVKQAESRILQRNESKGYRGLSGNLAFNREITSLILDDDELIARTTTIQSVAGTGALRLIAELIACTSPSKKVIVGTPAYINHIPILQASGLVVETYTYTTADGRIDETAFLAAIRRANAGDVILIQGCCHNPTGTSISPLLWERIGDALLETGVVPFIDQAYFGLGDGLVADLAGMRRLISRVPEAFVAVSASKAFSLYSERTGAAMVISDTSRSSDVRNALESIARSSYSQPPNHGAAIVAEILADPVLREDWMRELGTMQQRIASNREQLVAELQALDSASDVGALAEQRGMFLALPLGSEAMEELRNDHGIYGLPSGRVNIAGVPLSGIPLLARAIHSVQRRTMALSGAPNDGLR